MITTTALARRCVAPVGDVPDGATLAEIRICGRPASTSRTIEGLDCPLCPACAAEIDAEPSDDHDTN